MTYTTYRKAGLITALLIFASLLTFCQNHGFDFGKISYRELDMKVYEKDTSAVAVVLDEFGEAYIDNGDDNNLLFERHIKIKILKQAGLSEASFGILLYKSDSKAERVRWLKASSFNRVGDNWQETQLFDKDVFTENINKYYDMRKFAVPNVRVGSVIEVSYILESPFHVMNFRPWEFQSNIPKMRSEYWATIPGNYVYSITLKGFLKLHKNENDLIKDCFTPGGGNAADCARFKFTMIDIPALIEEDYMTAKSNFLASVNFELSELRHFDGRVDKVTLAWKDVEDEMRKDPKFGVQLRRGKDIVDTHVETVIKGEADPLGKAKKIYDLIKFRYQWNEVYGKYSEFGIRKAFENKKGNVGDINLSLIAALRYADLNVEPVILSTRENGLPIDIHPVLTDFNYVIAKLNIGDKSYLLDATDDYLPFGMIPIRCLNGKGRVLGEKESYWIDLKPADKRKQVSILTLKLEKDGVIRGKIQNNYTGYRAVSVRRQISSFSNQAEYIKELGDDWDGVEIKSYELKNVDDIDKPLSETLDIEFKAFDDLSAKHLLISPFFMDKWESNPFKSAARLYPVDFGAPLEETVVMTLEYPEEFTVTDLPEKVAIGLPNQGGRFIFEMSNLGNKITVNSALAISKTIYTSAEYHYLKELFGRLVSSQNTDIVLTQKER